MVTWECALNYTAMYALSKAIVAAGTVDDIYKIRASFAKAFPLLSDKYPNEVLGITNTGRMYVMASVQTITNGSPMLRYCMSGGQRVKRNLIR